ncbi:hypothetical protein FVR03_10975 [Pontibacter qinzhouensis]|uniref:Uncharacterized protein n=1 Tax=Pontibacter qinzhouensis TaxID=2603253 RepID=A0A5C8KAJ4_9BACT|nr:hypothetical protein [Pontibacter qinzhouensis]TXK46399.1 hypothetical protein FVR03_10975 [Pontibacter qinzhouensis]
MKKNILVGILALISFSGFGQQLKVTDDRLDKAVLSVTLEGYQMASIEMKQELNLTQEQYAKVEQLNKERYQQLKEAQLVQAEKPEEVQKTVSKINSSVDNALTVILSEDQLQNYLELEGRKKNLYMTDAIE